MDDSMTIMAEFHNKKLERAFFESDVKKSLSFIRYGLLILCSINFLLVIYDYIFLDAGGLHNIVLYSFIPRSIILIFAAAFYIASRKTMSYGLLLNCVSFVIPLFYALHLYMAYHFINLDLTSEALDVVFVLLCIALVPNRWIINLLLSVLSCVLFFLFSPLIIADISLTVGSGIAVYHFLIVLVISLFSFRINKFKRMQYAKELQLETLAKTDPLTKCYNRLKCDSSITLLCEDKMRFSTILFDIDNFKEINDTYGHIVGDRVLVEIVETTLESIRGIDILARWGGDEFLILLNGASLDAAASLAERLRLRISERKFENIPCSVTASFGVTEYQHGDSLYSIIDRVDRLLYLVKETGKNKTNSA